MEINTLLNKQWIKEEIKEEIKKYLETNKNGNTTYQTLRDAAEAVLRGKFLETINAYIKKQERSQINNLTLCVKELEKEQTEPKVSRRKEIKTRAEINEIETKKTIENETKSCFFRKHKQN